MTIGPSNLNFEFATTTLGVEASASESCKMDGTTSASCDVAFTIEAGATRTALTTSLILTGSQMALIPIELTGGLEKLAAATGSAVSTASGSVGAVSASGSDSVSIMTYRTVAARILILENRAHPRSWQTAEVVMFWHWSCSRLFQCRSVPS